MSDASIVGTRWRHKKRDGVYVVIDDSASIQCSCEPGLEGLIDEEGWTIYQNVESKAYFVRPTEEFLDGRFEQIS